MARGGQNRLTYESVKNFVESTGHEMLSKNYKNNKEKINIKCSCGYDWHVRFVDFKNGSRCPKCNNKIKAENNKYSYNYIKKYIELYNHELISTNYINSVNELKLRCPQGHIYKTTYARFYSGRRCPTCNKSHQSSKMEKEVYNIIKENYNGVILPNNRDNIINPSTGHNLELDIYLPEINKAIEFNGTYWHNKENTKNRDRIKKQECYNLGIDLLVIKEQDWIYNKEYCINKLKTIIADYQ